MNHIDLWAKTDQGKKQSTNFHPVICHLLDTAAVCQRLLQLLPPAAVRRLQCGLGLDEPGVLAWVPFLAGTHDTGKVSPPFQFQDSAVLDIAKQLASGSLYDLWSKRPKTLLPDNKTPGHGMITACTLPEYLQNWVNAEMAGELAAIVGGHHGYIPKHEDIEQITKRSQARTYHLGNSTESPQWRQWRIEILDILADYCGIKNTKSPEMCDSAAAVLLAGITTLSDWLASNQTCFSPAGAKPNLAYYIKGLTAKVKSTIKAAQWQEWQPHQQSLSFQELFQYAPRGLQEAIENLMPNLQGEPALLIVEAPTGEGKTEAALTVAHWNTSSGMPGTYVGMPTQTTGNKLYKRLKNYLNHWYPNQAVNFQLVHSASSLDDNFSSTICRLKETYENDRKPSGVTASEWFVHRKRALLAPWGVGTVDQALVGILRTKHQFLRLLGLAGKTVILDEVHAYDGYTSRLLDQLVHWCSILGSPVVVLSATLSSDQRQRLLNSYAEGLGLKKPELPVADYPRLTVYAQGKAWIDPSFTRDRLDKINCKREIKICWIEESQIDAQLDKGATAIIRSTVRRCQETAKRYEQAIVFHSRFTQEDRQRLEEYCEQTYGYERSHQDMPPRPPSLLSATQVIEQSLDLDFDVLISDICPIDLLIQRIGRLWRHDRIYRGVSERVIYLIRPQIGSDGLPNFGQDVEGRLVKGRYQPGVYDRHSLLRTWYLLRDRKLITLPHDTDYLIQQAYELEYPAPIELTEAQQQDWNSSLQAHQNYQKSLVDQAKKCIIPTLKDYCYAENLTDRSFNDDEVEMITRLINDSMTLILDVGDDKVIYDRSPVNDEIRQILRQQVRVANLGLIYAINKALDALEIKIPKAWKEVEYLRKLPLLKVPVKIGKYSITYDMRLGLIVSATSS
jgi:CRISPR-associated endonuclease/helicase Cas3